MADEYLRSMLAGESRAYGFTIAFWGSGALLINQFGPPNIIQALSFGFGAVLGFGILAFATLKDSKTDSSEQAVMVLSTVHYLSALMPMLVTHGAVQLKMGAAYTFLISGMSVSLLYNLFAVLEEDIAEVIEKTI
ncbi:MAG: hypothetical protein ACLFRK_00640 [Candidatus Nanohaloarchaea archaeon]